MDVLGCLRSHSSSFHAYVLYASRGFVMSWPPYFLERYSLFAHSHSSAGRMIARTNYLSSFFVKYGRCCSPKHDQSRMYSVQQSVKHNISVRPSVHLQIHSWLKQTSSVFDNRPSTMASSIKHQASAPHCTALPHITPLTPCLSLHSSLVPVRLVP